MCDIEYVGFQCVDPAAMLGVVNEESLRTHLVDHPKFDLDSVQEWMSQKAAIDSLPGCRIRAIRVNGVLAGWCGVQPDEQGFELAIVISKRFWGTGRTVFSTLMDWAGELGHREILFHLLDSRPAYKALQKRASKVFPSTMLGRGFTTYLLPVHQTCQQQGRV